MIDVVMPTYNRAAALRVTIDSYMSQPELGLFILMDDNSSDDTPAFAAALMEQYPGRVIYHREPKKTSTPHLRNVGISLSKNEYIFMGEDDVILPENHFKILLEKMDSVGADLIGGRRINLRPGETQERALAIANMDTRDMIVRIPFEQYHDRYFEVPTKVPVLHSNVLIKRTVFDTVKFDPTYDGNAFREETDFFVRAFGAGFSLWMIPDTIIYHLKGTIVNKKGGSKKKRWVYEWHVWKHTWRFFMRNKRIFMEKFNIKNLKIFATMSIIARYPYGLARYIEKMYHGFLLDRKNK